MIFLSVDVAVKNEIRWVFGNDRTMIHSRTRTHKKTTLDYLLLNFMLFLLSLFLGGCMRVELIKMFQNGTKSHLQPMLLFNMHVGNTVPAKGRPPQSRGTCSSWGHKPPVFHHRILKSLEIFELFIRRAFPHPSFCLCLLCCVLMFLLFIILTLTDTGFTFFLRSTAVKAHAQSSFNICSNPCSSCRLNGSYFWFPPPPLLSCS